MDQLHFRDHHYIMRRFPLRDDDRLRPWDAADEYLLRHFDESETTSHQGKILLVNDAFGALGVALHGHDLAHWGDSVLAQNALRHNLLANQLPDQGRVCLPSDTSPLGSFDLVLIKLPKNLTFFADQLQRLRKCLRPGARVVIGSMIKHTPARAYRLLSEIIGPTETTLGWKKARLAVSTYEVPIEFDTTTECALYAVPEARLVLANLPNVFSSRRLDLGTRLLIAHLPETENQISAKIGRAHV